MATLQSGNDNSLVIQAVGGAIASFPVDGIYEFGVDGDLPATTKVHGRITEDGVTITPTTSTTDVKGFPFTDTVATIVTDSSATFTLSLLQVADDENAEVWFGGKKDATIGGFILDPGKLGEKRAWVIDFYDTSPGRNHKGRWLFPSAYVSERGEIVINAQGLQELSVTFTAESAEFADTGIFGTGVLFTNDSGSGS